MNLWRWIRIRGWLFLHAFIVSRNESAWRAVAFWVIVVVVGLTVFCFLVAFGLERRVSFLLAVLFVIGFEEVWRNERG